MTADDARREWRRSWAITERVLSRPGFLEMLRAKLADLDRRWPR